MDAPSSQELLFKNLSREDLTIEDLVELANSLLEAFAPRQTRYKVRERPDVRTIRYYTNEKLLPKPLGYADGRARYSGAHLVRLLLIKKLQAEHYTLARIKQVLRKAGEQETLRALLPKVAASEIAAGKELPVRAEEEAERVALQQFQLSSGSALNVPDEVFTSSDKREKLAGELIRIARMLSSNDTEE